VLAAVLAAVRREESQAPKVSFDLVTSRGDDSRRSIKC
jgi:hypothetical protein